MSVIDQKQRRKHLRRPEPTKQKPTEVPTKHLRAMASDSAGSPSRRTRHEGD